MTVQALLTPIPYWEVLNKVAKLAIGGKMFAYRMVAPNEFKIVWQDPGRTFPFPTTGIPVRDNGTLPRMFFDNDEPYLLQFYDADGTLIETIDNFFPPNNGGTGPIIVNIDTDNHVLNGQADFPLPIPSPLTVGPIEVCEDVFFRKSNAAATDTITVTPFILGDAPEGTPKNFIEYNCTAVGAGGETYKDFYWVIDRVTGFANAQISVAFQLASTTLSTVEIFAWQFFGTGGMPSADNFQSLGTFVLTATLSKYQLTAIIDSIAGKTLGTNNDDQLYIILRLPLNALSNIQHTNFQFIPSDVIPPFHHFSIFFTQAIILGSRIPFPAADGSDAGKSLMVAPNGRDFMWGISGGVGQCIQVAQDVTENSGEWIGWLKIDSDAARILNIVDYPRLGALLSNLWGGDGVTTFGLPPLGAAFGMASNPSPTTRTARTVGQVVGQESITDVPAHSHIEQLNEGGDWPYNSSITGSSHIAAHLQTTVIDLGTPTGSPVSTQSTGSASVSIINPACVMCVMIKF